MYVCACVIVISWLIIIIAIILLHITLGVAWYGAFAWCA